jgi:hypothetical protein
MGHKRTAVLAVYPENLSGNPWEKVGEKPESGS